MYPWRKLTSHSSYACCRRVIKRCVSSYPSLTNRDFKSTPTTSSCKSEKTNHKQHWGLLAGSTILAVSAYSMWKKEQLSWRVYAAENQETEVVDTEQTKDSNENVDKDIQNSEDLTADSETVTAEEDAVTRPEFPGHVNYLIIGGGTAAYHACTAIKVKDTRGKVLIVSDEDFSPYSRPPLSKNLWFTKNREKAKYLFYEDGEDHVPIFYQRPGIYMPPSDLDLCENGAVALANNRKVVKLDVWRKKATLDNGTEITYDKCLIATGGSPKNLEVIEQADEDVLKRTLLFRGISDYWKLEAISQNSKRIAVIGGGFLGSELTCALAQSGKGSDLKIYQTFPESGNLGKILPENLSKWATKEMQNLGIEVKTNDEVTGASFEDGQCVVALKSGEKIVADYIVVAVGIKPNTELADSSGLEVDPVHGGFRVNAEMQARSDVYVAGDASCFYDQILGRRRVEHYEHAEITGHIAGDNMTGGNMPYWIQSSFWSDLYPFLNIEAIGLVDSSLETDTILTCMENPSENVSQTESDAESETTKPESALTEDFLRGGIVFYRKNDRIVGVLTWNLPGKSRVPLARRLLRDGGIGKDPVEIAQLFDPLAQNTFKKKEKPKKAPTDKEDPVTDSEKVSVQPEESPKESQAPISAPNDSTA